jgi:hypothetical protein
VWQRETLQVNPPALAETLQVDPPALAETLQVDPPALALLNLQGWQVGLGDLLGLARLRAWVNQAGLAIAGVNQAGLGERSQNAKCKSQNSKVRTGDTFSFIPGKSGHIVEDSHDRASGCYQCNWQIIILP